MAVQAQGRGNFMVTAAVAKKKFRNYTSIWIPTWKPNLNFWDWISSDLAQLQISKRNPELLKLYKGINFVKSQAS